MSLSKRIITVENEEWVMDTSNMDTISVVDRGGNSLALQRIDGKYFMKVFNPVIMQGVRTLDLRDDDIYLCAFPRTGTHWVFEIVSMLLNGSAATIPKFKGRNQLERTPAEHLAALPSPRCLNTHMCLSDGPKQLFQKKCKIIYNLRDPKDVAVSLYNFYLDAPFCEYSGEFKHFLYLFLEGKVDSIGIFGHILDAEAFLSDHPENLAHLHIYEKTTENPLKEIEKLSDFIGLPRKDKLCEAIAKKCEFSRMLVDKEPYAVKCNGKSYLFRKGVVGDWKNWFTDEMLEDYYRVYDEKMKGSRLYELYAKKT